MTDKPEMADQAPKSDSSESQQGVMPKMEGVFIRKASGMPYEEFVKVCIERFCKAGLIKD